MDEEKGREELEAEWTKLSNTQIASGQQPSGWSGGPPASHQAVPPVTLSGPPVSIGSPPMDCCPGNGGQTIEGAVGGSVNEAKWPRPVYFRENDPKKGYVYIIVNVPELTVTKSLFKSKPDNLEVCNPGEVFNEKEVYLRVNVTNREGKKITYEYKKSLPKPIDPKMSDLKFEKGIIKIRLKKEDVDLTWEPYSKVLTIRDN